MTDTLPAGFVRDDGGQLPAGFQKDDNFSFDAAQSQQNADSIDAPALDAAPETGGFQNVQPKPFVDPREALVKGAASAVGTIGTNIGAGFAGLTRAVPEVIKAGQDVIADIGGVGEFVQAARQSPIGQLTGASPVDINAPVEAVREVQQAGADVFAPTSAAGKAGTDAIVKTVEQISKPIKFTLSAVPRVIGGKEEQEKFLNVPIGDYLGELAQDKGASPLFATLASISPDIALSIGGVSGASRAGSKIAAKQVKQIPPTVTELKQQATALYKLVDDSGLKISDVAAQRGVARIESAMQKSGIRKSLNPDTASALNELIADAKIGGLTLSKTEELRQVINQAKGALKPKDAASAQRLGDLWDDFVEKLKPTDIAGAANVGEVRQYLKSARGLWSRARKTDEIQELLRKAEINVQSQQGNIGLSQAIRTQFRQLSTNKRRLRRFTPEERKFIIRVATGDAIERAARTLGKIAPVQTIPILGEIGVVGAAAATGNPALLAGAVALPVIGGLAKRISQGRTARFAKEADEVIRRGPKN